MISNALESGPRARHQVVPSGLYARFFKRLLDVALLLLIAPIAVLIVFALAAVIRADRGPVFYSQDRVGRDGRIFRMWKLRSMIVNADAELQALLERDEDARYEWCTLQKLKHDPRITPIGQVIRRTSLDELPQLWNVLVGDMSLVGPRPFLPEQKDMYPGRDYYKLRPGLTGFWQISERNESSFIERATQDSRYHESISFKTDLKVLLATVSVVCRGTGY